MIPGTILNAAEWAAWQKASRAACMLDVVRPCDFFEGNPDCTECYGEYVEKSLPTRRSLCTLD